MKRINVFLILITISAINLFPQVEWKQINSPTSLKIENIFCIDSLTCWAAGDSGLIIHTSDGGLNWTSQNTGVSGKIKDIFFLDNNYGWALSIRIDSIFGSYITKTTNGGDVWETDFFNIENKFLHSVYFFDSLKGWVAGGPSQAFYGTTDGGITWNIPRFDAGNYSTLPVQKIVFFSKEYGFACGGMHDLIGVIWKTTDGGLSWSSKNMGYEPLLDLYFIDSLNIIGVGGDFEYGTAVARTSDGGENWDYELPGYLGIATGLSFRNQNEAWATLGSERKFILSSDSGKTWNEVYTPNNHAIYDIVFTDSMTGFAVGDSGVILKYKFNPVSSANESKTDMPAAIQLFQNYPNPFNSSTKIQFLTNSNQFVSLKVFNLLGEEVAILINDYLEAGLNSISYIANSSVKHGLPSGVYFYQLKTGSFSDSRKMILLR